WQRPQLTLEFGNGTLEQTKSGLRTRGEPFWAGRRREKSRSKISCLKYIQTTATGSGRPSKTRFAMQRTMKRSTGSSCPTESSVGCQRAAAFNLIPQEHLHGFWGSTSTSPRANRRNLMRSAIAQSYLISVG